MNDTKMLVSTIDDKRSLKMFDVSTGEEADFDDLPEKQYHHGTSRCSYISNRNILVLTDKQENAVHMYKCDEKSKITRSLVVKDKDIKGPRAVCVAPDDSMFVVSENTNSIVHVSASGKLLSSFELDMTYPCALCMSTDGRRLVVSNSAVGNTKLQLFHVHTK